MRFYYIINYLIKKKKLKFIIYEQFCIFKYYVVLIYMLTNLKVRIYM